MQRAHSAHRNTTENVIYFALLAPILAVLSPSLLAAQVWLIGFALARLCYTYGYLSGRDTARSICMSLSLIALFGMAAHVGLSLLA